MKTVLNVKTDPEVKKRAQMLAKHLGIPLSTVVNVYLKEFISSGEFRALREPTLTPRVARELDVMHEDIRKGKNLSPMFTDTKSALAWLKDGA